MASATVTVSLGDAGLQYSSSNGSVLITGSGNGTRIILQPTLDDPTIELTLAPGTGISSLVSLTTPGSAFGEPPVVATGINIVMNCEYMSQLFKGNIWSLPTELAYTPTGRGQPQFHDPTIVYNPPS